MFVNRFLPTNQLTHSHCTKATSTAVNCLPLSNRKYSMLPCKTTQSTFESGLTTVSAPSVVMMMRRKLFIYSDFWRFFFSESFCEVDFFFQQEEFQFKTFPNFFFHHCCMAHSSRSSCIGRRVRKNFNAPPMWCCLALLSPEDLSPSKTEN